MSDFFSALVNPELPFLRFAILAGVLASLAFGMMGTFVVVKRISYIAGAIAHSVLGGIGIGLYLQYKLNVVWFEPLYGAIVTALLSAIIIGLVSIYAREREDTVIGAIWAIGMAVGIVFIAKTPGYVDPMNYLFGNILMISGSDLWMIAGLDLLVILLTFLFYNKFVAISFDDQFARLRGINIVFYNLLLLCLIALTILLLVLVVGIVMVIALLTIPAAISSIFLRRIIPIMIVSVLLSLFFVVGGIAASYHFDLPSGAVIILLAGSVYLIVVTVKYFRSRYSS